MTEFTYESLPDGGVLSRGNSFFVKLGGGTFCVHKDLNVYWANNWPGIPLDLAYLPNLRVIPPQLLL